MIRMVPKSVLTSVAIAIGCSLVASAGEVQISFNVLPRNVKKTVRRIVGAGEMIRITKETEKDGRVIFRVSYRVRSKKFEAEISPAGELIVVDEEISLADAPKAVAKVIEQRTATGQIRKIEKATKGGEIFYEVDFSRDGKAHEVKIAPDGNVLGVE